MRVSSWSLGFGGLSKRVMARSFEVGDRVRARTSSVVPAGTLGYVTFVFPSVVDASFVRFDGHTRQTLMRGVDLELVTDAPGDEDARDDR